MCAPERRKLPAQQPGDAMHHFTGGLVGECEQQDAVGGNALFEQVGDTVGERARLARTGTGNDEGRAGGAVTAASCCGFNSRA